MKSAWVLLLVLSACTSGSAPPSATNTPASNEPSSSSPAGAEPRGDWLAYDHDMQRTGVSSDQAALGKVHKAWASAALDAKIYAQPLIAGDRVIAATENNSVYSLEAATGKQAWHVNLGAPVRGGDLPCGNIDPSGITGTPVIDGTTLYVVAYLRSGPHHELYALDLGTGATRWHRAIDPPGLSATVEQERGALAIANGRVYVPFGGLFGDCGPYKGAVVSVPTSGTGALQSYIVPTQREAGIWNPGGVVAEQNGDVWVSTGNSASQSSFDYGNAIIRLGPRLNVIDYFAPSSWAELNAADADLGSVGPVLLPNGGVLAAGKRGIVYLLRRDRLGHIGGELASKKVCSRAFGTISRSGSSAFVACEDSLAGVRLDSNHIQVLWTANGGHGPSIVAAGAVWSLGENGTLAAFDPITGRVRFSTQIAEPPSRFIAPAAAAGRLVIAVGKRIAAFALR